MSSTNGNGKSKIHTKRAPLPIEHDIRKKLLAYMPGKWLQMPRIFLHVFDHNEMLVMAFLIDTADKFLRLKRREGWFPCATEEMEWEVNMAADTQQRTIKKLVLRGVLETKVQGFGGARRRFRILADALNHICDEARLKREEQAYKRRVGKVRKRRERDELRYDEERMYLPYE